MQQYLFLENSKIKDYNGNEIYVKDFRKRNEYNDNDILIGVVTQDKKLRPDIISNNLYSSVSRITNIIDVNDIDIFSFDVGGNFNYLNPNLIS